MSSGRGKNQVRARTLVHMQRMLAAAVAAGCSHEAAPTNTVTLSAPDAGASAPASDAAAVVRATPSVASSAGTPDAGYDQESLLTRHPLAASDPMPPPSACTMLASATATASLVRDAAGVVVELIVTLPTNHPSQAAFFPPAKIQSPARQPFVWGGRVLSARFNGPTAVVRILPDGTQQGGLTANFALTCAGNTSGSLEVSVRFAMPARAGAAVTTKSWTH